MFGDKLAGRADLGALKNGNLGTGGFMTARGVPEGVQQLGLLANGALWGLMEAFEETSRLPHQGLTRSSSVDGAAGRSAGGDVVHIDVPRGAIEDVVALLLKHGEF